MSAREEASHKARYVRLYADERGESHFADIEWIGTGRFCSAGAAAPRSRALPGAAVRAGVRSCGLGRNHPAPVAASATDVHPPWRLQVTASDGSVRRFPAGSLLLLEDTTGSGHTTRIVGTEELLVMTVTLGDEEPG